MDAMQWLRQLFHRETPQIPDALWQACTERLRFLHRLPEHDKNRLKLLSETLLDRKTFTAAGGLELTDEIAVIIAAQASLPVLNLTLDLYNDMAGIIIYPSEFVVPHVEVDDAGVMHEWRAPVSGEAVDAGGAIILSWEDVEESGAPGYNVVIHEFAHKIDMRDGSANGCPPFLAAYHADINPQGWQHAFSTAYDDFVRRVDSLDDQLPRDFDADDPAHISRYDELFAALPLDPYAAEHPAEFFAVASEAFFVSPEPLEAAYPEVYRLLAKYYRQDPLIARRKTASNHL
jgi:Mlc titration factor MtfA (ptsG expression regulator)